MGCLFPLARRKLSQAVVSNPIADKTQGGETQVGRHATHLAVAALTDAELQPAGWDGLALADGGIARPHRRFGHQAHPGRQRHAIFEFNPPAPLLQIRCAGGAFDLYPVGFPQFVAGLGQAGLQRAVIGEQQQPFAVTIQTAGGIDVADRNIILQGFAPGRIGELAKYHVGLVEENHLAFGWRRWRSPGVAARSCGRVDISGHWSNA